MGIDRLLNVSEVAARLSCSKATVWRQTAEGNLPEPIRLGRLTRWPESELSEFLAELKSRREGRAS
ncbi:helix-turn-helix transcriptional regulator [Pseudoroseicyclus tamaricis]|uniref:Helix-turn-helix domain-containing protein n=1 Tax=Pseudoroseicyclus tamaricis TaxID=2705421 RepID=A0A6B2JMR8_9RHOB|nr:helix-turn-helix domain-containing protein [Pseudoroseicyclus tamaricis]